MPKASDSGLYELWVQGEEEPRSLSALKAHAEEDAAELSRQGIRGLEIREPALDGGTREWEPMTQVFVWEPREVPPFEEMAQFNGLVREANAGVCFSAMFETESGYLACWIASRELTDAEALEIYYAPLEEG